MGRPDKWSEEQKLFLKKEYPNMEWDLLLKFLMPFTKQQIIEKASSLKIKRNNFFWSKEDIIFLKENYGKLSIREISKKLNKSEFSISTKLNKLKISKSKSWTNEEIKIVEDNYSNMSNPNIAKLLKNRKPQAIQDLAQKLGLKKEKYSYYNLNFIVENLKEYAKKINRTPFYHEVIGEDWCPSSITMSRNFGGYRKICELANLEINYSLFGKNKKMLKSKNDDICFSRSEVVITDFFIDNNISYQKEVLYKTIINIDKNIRSDWVLDNNIIVEYFGMVGKKFYDKIIKYKLDILNKNNVKYIFLYEKDIKNLKEIFREYIK
jgi:hypothetical protein